eukprot:s20_g8.t1
MSRWGFVWISCLGAAAVQPDALLQILLDDAAEKVKQQAPSDRRFPSLQHLDCEGLGFDERWKLLRADSGLITRSNLFMISWLEFPTESLDALRRLRGWIGETASSDASIPSMSLTLRALAIMMHDHCLPAAFQHVLDWDCLYFQLGNRSTTGCNESVYEHYAWWIDPQFTTEPGQELFCHFGCATALVLTALSNLLEDGVTDSNARAVMDQLQLAEALMGRGGDLDYASSSKWGSQLTSLAAVLIDFLASLGRSSTQDGRSALALARELQPCDPILHRCWFADAGGTPAGDVMPLTVG